jgi:hypothetical protein
MNRITNLLNRLMFDLTLVSLIKNWSCVWVFSHWYLEGSLLSTPFFACTGEIFFVWFKMNHAQMSD